MPLSIFNKQYEAVTKNISYLTVGRILTIVIKTSTFTLIVRSLDVSIYGQYITIITFCSFSKY